MPHNVSWDVGKDFRDQWIGGQRKYVLERKREKVGEEVTEFTGRKTQVQKWGELDEKGKEDRSL